MFVPNSLFKLGALFGASGVLLGAFGAHGLQRRVTDPKVLQTWGTAANYQLIHSIALLVASQHRSPLPARLFASGILVFSGSLYALVLSDVKVLGAVTPVGGLLLVGGWVALAVL
jgi:uncharacterized membrane protein YgdD (TMEM256/DUF423 family)